MGGQRENKVEVINYSEGMKNIIQQAAEKMVQRKKSDDEVLRKSVTQGAIDMANNGGTPI